MDEFDDSFEEDLEEIDDMEEIDDQDLEDIPQEMSHSKISHLKESDISMSVSHIDMEKENLNQFNNKQVQKLKTKMNE